MREQIDILIKKLSQHSFIRELRKLLNEAEQIPTKEQNSANYIELQNSIVRKLEKKDISKVIQEKATLFNRQERYADNFALCLYYYAVTQYNRGAYYQDHGDFEQALACYERSNEAYLLGQELVNKQLGNDIYHIIPQRSKKIFANERADLKIHIDYVRISLLVYNELKNGKMTDQYKPVVLLVLKEIIQKKVGHRRVEVTDETIGEIIASLNSNFINIDGLKEILINNGVFKKENDDEVGVSDKINLLLNTHIERMRTTEKRNVGENNVTEVGESVVETHKPEKRKVEENNVAEADASIVKKHKPEENKVAENNIVVVEKTVVKKSKTYFFKENKKINLLYKEQYSNLLAAAKIDSENINPLLEIYIEQLCHCIVILLQAESKQQKGEVEKLMKSIISSIKNATINPPGLKDYLGRKIEYNHEPQSQKILARLIEHVEKIDSSIAEMLKASVKDNFSAMAPELSGSESPVCS